MTPESLYYLQIVAGAGVGALNAVVGWRLFNAWRMRRDALLAWPPPRPPYYGLMLLIGVMFGGLVLIEVFVLRRSFGYWFFDLMMLVFYGYLTPLSARVPRGFFRGGIWADKGFVPYDRIGSLSWREAGPITLVIVLRARRSVRRLLVPARFYAEARRLLRDRIEQHQIQMERPGLDLGARDARDDV